MRTGRNIYILILIVTGWSCRKAYNPKIVASPGSYLVVEGAINTGNDSTVIRLSRTVPLSSTARSKPEPGAVLTIISSSGNSYPMTESGRGFYKASGLNVDTTARYALKIITAGGIVYQSDFVPVKNSPPIDSVYYRISANGIKIYADTHDPANKTNYYKWEFVDTYKFHAGFSSFYYVLHNPDIILPRDSSRMQYYCWHSDTSSSIYLNSSARLSRDVIENNLIASIASDSESLENRYSIIVKQYALTPGAFNYYQLLKKNTELLGSIFDAQPSQLPGNIHCITSSGEFVLGYISAGSVVSQRIFIDARNLPAWRPKTPYSGCMLDTDLFCAKPGCKNQVAAQIYPGYQIPVFAIYAQPPFPPVLIGYSGSSEECVDCTLRGTNKKPAFWTDQ